jgi:hypothetical protein
MHVPSSTSCEPIKGEALRLSRWHTATAVLIFLTAVLVGGGGIFLIFLAVEISPADIWFTSGFGVLLLLVAGHLASSGWHVLTHRPCLVLGRDRLQLRLGKHVRWEVRYSDIADVALFTPAHPLGFRMAWTFSLGIRLTNPELFDGAHPQFAWSRESYRRRCGFDLGIPMMCSCEPTERCLEAVLRCYRRFKADQQELR